jgi:hypothetical protein
VLLLRTPVVLMCLVAALHPAARASFAQAADSPVTSLVVVGVSVVSQRNRALRYRVHDHES